jgi:hypothetical protein
MIRTKTLRELFTARVTEAMAHGTDLAGYKRGGVQFVKEFHDTLGVRLDTDLRPGFNTDPTTGVGYKPAGTARADEVSLRHLAEALMGHEFVEEYYHPSGGFDMGNRHLLEVAIDPTSFVNVSLFNLSVAGLVNAEIIAHYDMPDYIGRQLITVKPTNMNGQKLIGTAQIAPVSKAAKGRMPGEHHAEVGFTEKYQTTPETVEQALKCVLTKEAVYFDYTGQVLETAGTVGDELAYGQEKDIADMVMGVTGLTSRYNFVGTTYETYQATSPWVNDIANPFSDETDVDDARQLFVGMVDPITGREVKVMGRDILCMPARELKFRQQLFGSGVQIGTQLTSGYPGRVQTTPVQVGAVSGGAYTVRSVTPIWYNRALAADGLNLAAAAAKEYWWVGDLKKAFWWMENWPLTPWQASADELIMKDRGLIAVFGANYRGIGYVREPRYVVRNKDA